MNITHIIQVKKDGRWRSEVKTDDSSIVTKDFYKIREEVGAKNVRVLQASGVKNDGSTRWVPDTSLDPFLNLEECIEKSKNQDTIINAFVGTIMIVAVLLFFGAIYKIFNWGFSDDDSRNTAELVNITSLIQQYKSNELRADQRYRGNFIKANGVVRAITRNSWLVSIFEGKYAIRFGAVFGGAKATFDGNYEGELSHIQINNSITITCKVDGLFISTVELVDCSM